MKANKIILFSIIFIGFLTSCHQNNTDKSVSSIDNLIGKDLNYACEVHYKTKYQQHYRININHRLHEFHGGILKKKNQLIDSIIDVYTWTFQNHKETIWIGKTTHRKNEIIDALWYENDVEF